MICSCTRRGSIFLLGVLLVGSIASTTAIILVLSGLNAQFSARAFAQSRQAYANAVTCMERTIYVLREDETYAGNETHTLDNGLCTINRVARDENGIYKLCAEGKAGTAISRLEVTLLTLHPNTRSTDWRKVSMFSSECTP